MSNNGNGYVSTPISSETIWKSAANGESWHIVVAKLFGEVISARELNGVDSRSRARTMGGVAAEFAGLLGFSDVRAFVDDVLGEMNLLHGEQDEFISGYRAVVNRQTVERIAAATPGLPLRQAELATVGADNE